MRRFDYKVLAMGFNNTGYPGAFSPAVERIIKEILYGKILHLYSGNSLIGDIRIDIKHPNATSNMAVEDFIKHDNNEWDFVLLDPPYNLVGAETKLKEYGNPKWPFGNLNFRFQFQEYLQRHTSNILWLDFAAPIFKGFARQKLWVFLPGGYRNVRVLSWLKKEMDLLL